MLEKLKSRNLKSRKILCFYGVFGMRPQEMN